MVWRNRLRWIPGALIVTIVALPTAFAEKGRDFSASYALKDEAPVGANRISVTLILLLHNHSGADIADAEVSMLDGMPAVKSVGVFPMRVSLANHGVATLSGTFVVPNRYVAEWQTGQRPHIVVRFTSAQGRVMRQPVELRFVPGLGR